MSTWVFLRGLMREARHWGRFPEIFRSEIPDAGVEFLDLPGNGRLHHLRSPMRIEEMVESCRQELARRGVAPPYHLLALSLGAMVAMAWSARYAEDIRACVLINTSVRSFSPFYRRLRAMRYPELLRLGLRRRNIRARERTILRLTSRFGDARADVLESWIGYAQECPTTGGNVLRQLVAAARYRAPAHRPEFPILLLASAGDHLVDPVCSHHLAERWQAPLAIHPHAGHDLPLDDGPWVTRQVRDWLVTLERASDAAAIARG